MHYIIIGGGVAGLSAAIALGKRGEEVDLYEKESHVGGLCTNWSRPPYTFNGCMHWLLGSSSGTSFYDMWNSIIDIDKLDFIYHEVRMEMPVRARNARGEYAAFRLFSDAERLRSHLIENAPEDSTLINRFVNAVCMASKHLNVLPPLWNKGVFGNFRQALTMTSMLTVLDIVRYFGKFTTHTFSEQCVSEWLKEVFRRLYTTPTPMVAVVFSAAYANRGVAGYPIGGSAALTHLMERSIPSNVHLHLSSPVTNIIVKRGKATSVILEDGNEVSADHIVSAADWYWTMNHIVVNGKPYEYKEPSLPLYHSYCTLNLGVHMPMDGEPHFQRLLLDEPLLSPDGTMYEEVELEVFNFDRSLTGGDTTRTCMTINLPTHEGGFWIDLYRDNMQKYRKKKNILAGKLLQILSMHYGSEFAMSIEAAILATPATYHRFTNNHLGSSQGWQPSLNVVRQKGDVGMSVHDIKSLSLCGHWTMMGGGLPIAMRSGLLIP
ncbi:MAG: NAD(P)/FAD-dependent oxidoreductase [Marinilabiliaceae bacterium]|nr:NAD(P)/FAD-dependent oxidoreductase [Marinilabiliaceae bacterium]